MSLEPGSLLAGKYQIQDEIGKGAYGRVYRARDTSLGRDVAIKELRKGGEVGSTDYADYVRRFEREAQVQAGFIHPNIVQVYELVKPKTEGDAYYLVMEYVDGKSLKEVLERGGPLPPDKALGIFCDILNGLEAVHAGPRDIVHRDIKPSNILLTRSDQAKLADFGQAQVRDESMRTRTGQPHPGAPVYMSPEQETTQAYLYPASDIFSAGCVLFEMLTGQGYKSARSRGQSLADLRPDLPARVGKALEKALAEDRASRYPSAGEFAKALGCPGRAEPAPQPAPHKTGLPTWAWIVGGLAVFFVVVAALGAIGIKKRRAEW